MAAPAFVKNRALPTSVGEAGVQELFGNRASALVASSLKERLIAAGYGYHVSVGAFSTGVRGGGAGSVYDPEQAELVISVPSGTAIMPLRIAVELNLVADVDGEVHEATIVVDRTAVSTAASGTGTVETAFNMRSDNPRASGCTVVSANTSDHNTPTFSFELAKAQLKVNIVTGAETTQGMHDLVYEPAEPPILVGPCALYVYWGTATAGGMLGYCQAEWVELPEALNSLWGGS